MESGLYTYLATQLRVSTAEGNDGPAASVFEPWGCSDYNSRSAFNVFHVPGPSVLQTVNVCGFLKRRGSARNLIVTVFVATVGMFTSGWASSWPATSPIDRWAQGTRRRRASSEGNAFKSTFSVGTMGLTYRCIRVPEHFALAWREATTRTVSLADRVNN